MKLAIEKTNQSDGLVTIDRRQIQAFVRDSEKLLGSPVSVQTSQGEVMGWHQHLRADRIGTTGSAVPGMFLNSILPGNPILQKVELGLRQTQSMVEGIDHGGWSILSFSQAPIVAATAWCVRALIAFGAPGSRSHIDYGEEWLLRHQDSTGGWGFRCGNSCEVLTTAQAIAALASVNAPMTREIMRGREWLLRSRRGDGTWGRHGGDEGTLLHTAIAIIALVKSGMSQWDPQIRKSLDVLIERWVPTGMSIEREAYEVKHAGGYGRITLEHDVDAAILECLQLTRGIWMQPKAVFAIKRMLSLYEQAHVPHCPEMTPSIWSFVPRASVMAAADKQFPTNVLVSTGARRELIVCTNQEGGVRILRLALAVGFSHTAMNLLRRHFAGILAALFLIVSALMAFLHAIEWRDFYYSIAIPVVLMLVELGLARRGERR